MAVLHFRSVSEFAINTVAALVWLKGSYQGTLFAGASPMAYMLEGGHDGLMSVRRYLGAWRGGNMGAGATEGSFEAVTEDDLVFA